MVPMMESSTSTYYRSIPFKGEGLAFLDLFALSMSKNNWVNVDFRPWRLLDLLRYKNEVRVLIFHWPESFWRRNSLMFMSLKILQFIITTKFAHILGYKLVQFVHNFQPHIKSTTFLERMAEKYVYENFHYFVTLSEHSYNQMKSSYGYDDSKIIKAKHGLYDKYYSKCRKDDDVTISQALQKDDFEHVLLLFVNTHHLSDCQLFIDSFISRFSASSVKLILVGNSVNRLDFGEAKLDNVFKHEGFVDESQLEYIFQNIDGLVLPYREIWTSGLYCLALTYKVPIIMNNSDFAVAEDPEMKTYTYLDALICSSILSNELERISKNYECSLNLDDYSWDKTAEILISRLCEG